MRALILALTFGVPIAAWAASLAEQPVVFKAGNWSVRRAIDPMTDAPECTGIYKDDFRIQLAEPGRLFITTRGGPQGYILRFDDEPPTPLRLTGDTAQRMNLVMINGVDFAKLLSAHRLRYEITTLIDGVIDGDLDLTGIGPALDNMNKGCPGDPIAAAKTTEPQCSVAARAKLKEKGMSAKEIAEICGD